MKDKRCVVCGFDKKAEEHHLQKVIEFGSEEDSNKVYLCPNHHWIADFGDEEDKRLLLKYIKDLTGKEPVMDEGLKSYYEKLIRASIENSLGQFSDEEYEKEMKPTWNYLYSKKILLSRPSSTEYSFKQIFLQKCELLYLRSLINKSLEKLKNPLQNA